MKNLLYISIVLLAFSCNYSGETILDSDRTNTYLENDASINEYENKAFFDFDAIHHYSTDVDAKAVYDLYEQDSLTDSDKMLMAILMDPVSQDFSFINNLEKLNFIQKDIDSNKLELINDLFKVKIVDEYTATACEPLYRDVLIFRKNSDITGIAKICFGCDKHSIIGAKVPTASFGQSGEYQKLGELLE